MTRTGNIQWIPILKKISERIASTYGIDLLIDETIIFEIGSRIEDSLATLGFYHPNAAKIARLAAYWTSKLNPFSIAPNSKNHFRLANERAPCPWICKLYKDDFSRDKPMAIPARLMEDWVVSLRYEIHSPGSAMTAFELLMCDC